MTATDPEADAAIVHIVEENGRRLRIVVTPGEQRGWALEIDDLAGNRTVWEDGFATSEAALAEGFDAIAEQGVAFFIADGITADNHD